MIVVSRLLKAAVLTGGDVNQAVRRLAALPYLTQTINSSSLIKFSVSDDDKGHVSIKPSDATTMQSVVNYRLSPLAPDATKRSLELDRVLRSCGFDIV